MAAHTHSFFLRPLYLQLEEKQQQQFDYIKMNGQNTDTRQGIGIQLKGTRPMGQSRSRWFSQVLEDRTRGKS
jgi:hypothetical protein